MSCTGTSASFARGCRCDTCRSAEKKRRLERQRNGAPSYRRATKARRHLNDLFDRGMSRRQCAMRSGVDQTTLKRVAEGEQKRILDRTERSILALRPTVSAWSYVPAAPTIARIQRLRAQGYSKEFIAEKVGLSSGGALPQDKPHCRAYVANRIKALCEFVGDSPGVARDGSRNGRRALTNEQRRMTA